MGWPGRRFNGDRGRDCMSNEDREQKDFANAT
jgi:hypothetical protein